MSGALVKGASLRRWVGFQRRGDLTTGRRGGRCARGRKSKGHERQTLHNRTTPTLRRSVHIHGNRSPGQLRRRNPPPRHDMGTQGATVTATGALCPSVRIPGIVLTHATRAEAVVDNVRHGVTGVWLGPFLHSAKRGISTEQKRPRHRKRVPVQNTL